MPKPDEHQMRALSRIDEECKSLVSFTCPIYIQKTDSDRKTLLGTGIPFVQDGVSCLVTASHVLDSIVGGRVLISDSNSFVSFPLVCISIDRHDNTDVDISAFALPSQVAQRMSAAYTFSSLSAVSDFEAYDEMTLYVICGFPLSRNKPAPKWQVEIEPEFVYYMTKEEVALPSGRVSPNKDVSTHVALNLNTKNMMHPNGHRSAAPSLRGRNRIISQPRTRRRGNRVSPIREDSDCNPGGFVGQAITDLYRAATNRFID